MCCDTWHDVIHPRTFPPFRFWGVTLPLGWFGNMRLFLGVSFLSPFRWLVSFFNGANHGWRKLPWTRRWNLSILLQNVTRCRDTSDHCFRNGSSEGVLGGICDDYLGCVKSGDGGEKRIRHDWNVKTIHCPLSDYRPISPTGDLWVSGLRDQALNQLLPNNGSIIQIYPMVQSI